MPDNPVKNPACVQPSESVQRFQPTRICMGVRHQEQVQQRTILLLVLVLGSQRRQAALKNTANESLARSMMGGARAATRR